MPQRKSIPVLSVFCGAGGLDFGFRQAGFAPVLALDINADAVKTYNKNRGRKIAVECDLNKTSATQLINRFGMIRTQRPRAIIGGPPCQGFSRGNVKKKRNDPRSRLAHSFTKLVHELNSRFSLDFVFFENVVGLRNADHRFNKIKRELRKAGFNIFVEELDAVRFGVPQRRRRLLIVGINCKKYPWLRFSFPTGSSEQSTVQGAISGLPAPTYHRRDLLPSMIHTHQNHWTMNPRSPKFKRRSKAKGRSFRRLLWDRPSMTVAYGHREIHVHPDGNRRLSVYEAMLLQGFPASYKLLGSFSAQVKQVSDAVPPPLAHAVAVQIRESLYGRISALQDILYQWFLKNGRTFPWRTTRDPFQILIAEKLLQQTAANETVSKIFQEIVGKYPNPAALAKAKEKDLRRVIAPLGFLYRAKELIKLAKYLGRHTKWSIPNNLGDLLNIPGVGDYCARAVLAFAFNQPIAIVDTNVARFLVRFFDLKIQISQNPARSKALQLIADALIPTENSREFNLALLDICARHCKARQPLCLTCPLRFSCEYYQSQSKSNHT